MFGICIVKLSPVWILLVVNNTTVSSGGKRWQLSNSFLTEYWCRCLLLDSLTFRGIILLSDELCHAPRKWALCIFLFWAAFLLGQDHDMTTYNVYGMKTRACSGVAVCEGKVFLRGVIPSFPSLQMGKADLLQCVKVCFSLFCFFVCLLWLWLCSIFLFIVECIA